MSAPIDRQGTVQQAIDVHLASAQLFVSLVRLDISLSFVAINSYLNVFP